MFDDVYLYRHGHRIFLSGFVFNSLWKILWSRRLVSFTSRIYDFECSISLCDSDIVVEWLRCLSEADRSAEIGKCGERT